MSLWLHMVHVVLVQTNLVVTHLWWTQITCQFVRDIHFQWVKSTSFDHIYCKNQLFMGSLHTKTYTMCISSFSSVLAPLTERCLLLWILRGLYVSCNWIEYPEWYFYRGSFACIYLHIYKWFMCLIVTHHQICLAHLRMWCVFKVWKWYK